MTELRIKTARCFVPLLQPARYKGAFGGRGSGKSHFFAGLSVEDALRFPGETGEGLRMICIREVQKDLSQSSKLLIEDKLSVNRLGEADGFKVWKDRLEFPGDGICIFKGMNDYSAESAKSLEGFRRAWIDEAQVLSPRSLSLLRPTIHRWPGSEIWASWNPTRKSDAIDEFFRGPKGVPEGAICVQANWRDNPFWNESAEQERQLELARYPERYDHTYEGGYAKAFEGAYFAGGLAEARLQGRIGRVAADPLLPLRLFWDIGGAGRFSDAKATIIAQFIEKEIRVLGYVETVGQVLGYHIAELRAALRPLGFTTGICHLPHDGVNTDNITGKQFADHLREAGFEVPPPVPNQGRGAAAMRIEALRRLFPRIWFNEATTEPLREALGYYHERKDDNRNVGLGPEHDWSSHGADAAGLMAVVYEEPSKATAFGRKLAYRNQGYA